VHCESHCALAPLPIPTFDAIENGHGKSTQVYRDEDEVIDIPQKEQNDIDESQVNVVLVTPRNGANPIFQIKPWDRYRRREGKHSR
jgi:hypothetical protein